MTMPAEAYENKIIQVRARGTLHHQREKENSPSGTGISTHSYLPPPHTHLPTNHPPTDLPTHPLGLRLPTVPTTSTHP